MPPHHCDTSSRIMHPRYGVAVRHSARTSKFKTFRLKISRGKASRVNFIPPSVPAATEIRLLVLNRAHPCAVAIHVPYFLVLRSAMSPSSVFFRLCLLDSYNYEVCRFLFLSTGRCTGRGNTERYY